MKIVRHIIRFLRDIIKITRDIIFALIGKETRCADGESQQTKVQDAGLVIFAENQVSDSSDPSCVPHSLIYGSPRVIEKKCVALRI